MLWEDSLQQPLVLEIVQDRRNVKMIVSFRCTKDKADRLQATSKETGDVQVVNYRFAKLRGELIDVCAAG